MDGDTRERETVDDGNDDMDTQRTTGGGGNGGTTIRGRDDGTKMKARGRGLEHGDGMGRGTGPNDMYRRLGPR
jgi:hypothetical protein